LLALAKAVMIDWRYAIALKRYEAMTVRSKNMIVRNIAGLPTAEPTLSAGFTKALLDFAVVQGADEARLLQRSGLRAADLADQDDRIPVSRYAALMRAGKEETGNAALALEFGAASDFRKFSVVGLISHASANMMEALGQLNRFGRLVVEIEGLGEGPRFRLVERAGSLWMEDLRPDPNSFPEFTESTLSRFIVSARRDFPQHTFALEAQVTHPAPPYRARYDTLWQIPVTFGSERNAIRIHPGWTQVQIQPEARYVFGVLTERGDALLQDLENSKTLRGRVEAMTLPVLHTGTVSVDRIAARLGVSRQTLYRNLKAEGVTFAEVLDTLRHKMALHYLAGQQVSVNETAYLVGFSDPSAFSRAFKRWTGSSPRDLKAARRARSDVPV
jgi:AraC-like DNA-binding protein